MDASIVPSNTPDLNHPSTSNNDHVDDSAEPSLPPADQSQSRLSDPHTNPAPDFDSSSDRPFAHVPTVEISSVPSVAASDQHESSSSHSDDDGRLVIIDHEADSSTSPRRTSSSSESVQRHGKRRLDPALYEPRRSGRNVGTHISLQETSDDSDSGDGPVHTSKRRKRTSNFQTSKAPSPIKRAPSLSDSDEDEEFFTNKKLKRRSKAIPRRLAELSSRSETPQRFDARFSSRSAAQGVTYAENESGDEDEDWDSVQNWTYVDPAGEKPGVDEVIDYRPRMTAESERPTVDSLEYLIKWVGEAYYHAEWMTYDELKSRKGLKKVKNYLEKYILEDLSAATASDMTTEAKEQWILDREKHMDAVEEFKKVDRVIASRPSETDTDYMVKWRGLTYDYCTWESAELVSDLAQEKIDRFLNHSMQNMTSDKTESRVTQRSRFSRLQAQPDYIKNGTLRDFQLQGLNFLAFNWCNGRNAILADEMGLGKTVQSVSFLSWLKHARRQMGPFLVIVPLSTLPAWADTFDVWAPDMQYVPYLGNAAARETIRNFEFYNDDRPPKTKFNILLTTYEVFLGDAKFFSEIHWQLLAVDEAHRLKNRESQLYTQLDALSVGGRVLITGTPVQNNLKELAALIDFIAPGEVQVDDSMLDGDAADRRIAELNMKIKPLLLRRTKEEVENDLPPKREKILRVELADSQLELYKNVMTKNYEELNRGATGAKQSLLNIVMQLKKASNHPFMFESIEDKTVGHYATQAEWIRGFVHASGKMMLLDRLLKKLKAENHRVLIFSQMVEMLNLLGHYMRMRGYQCERLDGTTPSNLRKASIDRFNAPDSGIFAFLLSTRAGGLGINLMTADTVILFDSDWNPQADLQAMARAHRIGQKNPVSVYRLVSKDTIEEEIIERARNKLMLEAITIQQGYGDTESKSLAKKAAKQGTVDEPTSANDISRLLRRRGQKMFEQTGNQQKLEELDIDMVLENAEEHETIQGGAGSAPDEFLRSLEYTDVVLPEWDEIIPESQLAQIKEQREKDETDRLVAELAAQNDRGRRKAIKNGHDPVDAGREERAAKKQARARPVRAASESDDDESDAGADPSRPLQEKEIRNLVRAYEKYGAMEDKRPEILADAKLGNRTFDVVKATLDEVLGIAAEKIAEEKARLRELERSENKSATKKDKKAVLFDFKGVKRLNAETLTERAEEMRVARSVTSMPDIQKFRVNGASKPANYTCEWGARQDGMLCVGIARHGFGAWAAIRDDVELGLGDKLFLEEHRIDQKEERSKNDAKNARSPGAVHLVRRANYLFSVLKANASNDEDAKRALQNHHRNNKKPSRLGGEPEKLGSASPAPGAVRKGHSGSENGQPRRVMSNGNAGSRERHADDLRRPKSGDGYRDRPREGSSHSSRPVDSKERPHSQHHHHREGSSSHQTFSKSAHRDSHDSRKTSGGASPKRKSDSTHFDPSSSTAKKHRADNAGSPPRKLDGHPSSSSVGLKPRTESGGSPKRKSDSSHFEASSSTIKKIKSEGEKPSTLKGTSNVANKAERPSSRQGEHASSSHRKHLDHFFNDARELLRSLRKTKEAEKPSIDMQPLLAKVYEYIDRTAAFRPRDHVEQCWEYVRKFYWPLSSKITAEKARDLGKRCHEKFRSSSTSTPGNSVPTTHISTSNGSASVSTPATQPSTSNTHDASRSPVPKPVATKPGSPGNPYPHFDRKPVERHGLPPRPPTPEHRFGSGHAS